MVKNSVIDTIEKVFRYFIPGVIFILLYKLSFPSSPKFILENIGGVKFYIFIPCLGMIIYGLHRVCLSTIVEPILYKCNLSAVSNFASNSRKWKEYPKAIAAFLRKKFIHKQKEENLSDYLFYRWSIQHYSLILSELLFVFYFINEPESIIDQHKCVIFLLTTIIFILSFSLTLIMYQVEKGLFHK